MNIRTFNPWSLSILESAITWSLRAAAASGAGAAAASPNSSVVAPLATWVFNAAICASMSDVPLACRVGLDVVVRAREVGEGADARNSSSAPLRPAFRRPCPARAASRPRRHHRRRDPADGFKMCADASAAV